MERDVRYLFVGITIALLTALLIGFVLWQAKRYGDTDGELYTVTVEGSVAGVDIGRPVRYLGVPKGRVTAMRLSAVDSETVEIDIDVQPDVPISRSTRASIEAQGITGTSYVALRTPDPDAGPPAQPEWARHPVIPAEPSQLEVLMESAPQTLAEITELTERAQRLLTAENAQRLTSTLENLDQFSGRLETMADDVEQLLAQSTGTLEQTNATLMAFEAGADQIAPTLAQGRAAARTLDQVAQRLDDQLARNGPALDRLAEHGIPEAEALLRDMRRAATAFEQLSRDLERKPAQLIHKRQEGGMEIPR